MGISGFSGSAAAMIQSLRNNKKQLAQRDSYFDKNKKRSKGSYGEFVDHKKMSPYEFKLFQKKLKANELSRQRRVITIFGLIMVVIIGTILYFY